MNQTVPICNRLKQERQRLGLNQTEFGESGGVTKKTQMLYESGERTPSADYLAAIAALGVDVLFVVTGIPTDPYTLARIKELALVAKSMGGAVAEQFGKDIQQALPEQQKEQRRQARYNELVLLLGQCPEEDLDAVLGIARQLHQARSGVK